MTRPMKDSGIAWIGLVPESWNIARLKRFAFINNGKEIAEEITKCDGAIPVYGSGGVFKYANSYLYNGETVMFGRKGTLGKPIYANEKLWTVDTMYFLTYSADLSAKYNYYQLSAFDWGPHITQTALPSIVGSEIVSCIFAFPPLAEQSRIAAFLDEKCAAIDTLIEQTRASIEEYKKLKQSVITYAVTKGIRPNRKMKDSGIEWVGEIPEEWETRKLKYVVDFEPKSEIHNLGKDALVTYTPMEYIKKGYFIQNIVPLDSLSSSLTVYEENDIVMAKVTPCFENGNIAIMRGLASGVGLGSSELFVFRAKEIECQYLFYWLQNKVFLEMAKSTMTGAAGLKRVSPYFIRNCRIHYPSTDEQSRIAAFLVSGDMIN